LIALFGLEEMMYLYRMQFLFTARNDCLNKESLAGKDDTANSIGAMALSTGKTVHFHFHLQSFRMTRRNHWQLCSI